MAGKHMPDLILLDLQMPVMGGFAVIRELRKTPELSKLKVIAVTSFAMKGDREKALEAGFDEYVTKPIDTRKFVEIVKNILPSENMTLKKPIILCVDDGPANLKLLENILVPRGYEVVSAANGEDALLKIKTRTIDLVLLDLMLPGMDGLQVSRKIKDNKKYRNIPIIMLPAYRGVESYIKSLSGEVFAYLHSGKNWSVEVQTLGREKVTTPAGEFATIKVRTFPKYEGVFMNKGEIFIWLTDTAGESRFS